MRSLELKKQNKNKTFRTPGCPFSGRGDFIHNGKQEVIVIINQKLKSQCSNCSEGVISSSGNQ